MVTEYTYDDFHNSREKPLNALGFYLFVDGYDVDGAESYKSTLQEAADEYFATSSTNSVNNWYVVHGTCRSEFASLFGVEGDLLPAGIIWNPKIKRECVCCGSLAHDCSSLR